MHSTRHDSQLAALHASGALPGHVVDVVVLTTDESLLATLREASGPEHALWRAASADAAVDLLVGGRCGVLIADIGALRGDVHALIERLHAQFPELVLLATGRRDEEAAVAKLVSSGLIYRFLHKPVSPARAGLFISAATRRYQELRNIEPVAMATVRTIAARPHVGKIAAGIGAVLVMALAFVFWRGADQSAPIVVPQASIAGATRAEQIADYMGRAQIAIATGRLADPRGDNALDYYRAVLALEPEHAEANAGIARVAAALEQRLRDALNARNAAAGAALLASLQRANPEHPRVDALRTELLAISRSRPAPPAAESAPAAAPTSITAEQASAPHVEPESELPPSTVADSAGAAREEPLRAEETTAPPPTPDEPSDAQVERIVQLRERGALIAPPGANAYDELARLREQFPEAAALRTEQQRLAFVLLERARTALLANQLDEAAPLLSAAEELVPGMGATRGLREQLSAAQAAREFARNVVQAAALKRTKEVAPVYPRDAERQGVEGWVDVEFTIAPDGSTQDLVVRQAEPRDVFERAAVDSVRRWRFEPIVRDGRAVAQRAILRVRFTLR